MDSTSWTPIVRWGGLALAFAILIAHSLLFRHWIIDDAGISFVYARNFADGYGLVSQPYQPPIEGFSNPSWVFLLSPFFALRIFHPIITPKVISIILTVISFSLLQKTIKRLGFGYGVGNFVLILLAINTSFVVWSSSGLENPLYVCLIVVLFTILATNSLTNKRSVVISVIASLIALTRPDGMLFLLLFPIWIVWTHRTHWQAAFRPLSRYSVGTVIVFGGYILFRLAYFRDALPNTYYAKDSVGAQYFGQVLFLIPDIDFKLLDLIGSTSGLLRLWVLIIFLVAVVWIIAKNQFTQNYQLVGIFFLFTFALYMLLPPDWMEEYRFATPFYPFFYLLLAISVNTTLSSLQPANFNRLRFFFASLFLLLSVTIFVPRSLTFAASPTVPFNRIANNYAFPFNTYAERLELEAASFLLPDLGGTLYYSELEIIDLAGLTDAIIARELYNDDKTRLHDYIFEERQPTFIHTHGFFNYRAQLDTDPRFDRDYVALCEFIDPLVLQSLGVESRAGDFIRRDVITDNNYDELEAIREEMSC